MHLLLPCIGLHSQREFPPRSAFILLRFQSAYSSALSPASEFDLMRGVSQTPRAYLNFSLKYLLLIITLYAIAIGLTHQLKFSNDPALIQSSVADSYFEELWSDLLMGARYTGQMLPVLPIPLLILYDKPSRRAVAIVIAFWLFVTGSFVCYAIIASGDNIWAMLSEDSIWGFTVILGIPQASTAVAGILTAVSLRLVGVRLIRVPHIKPAITPIATSTNSR